MKNGMMYLLLIIGFSSIILGSYYIFKKYVKEKKYFYRGVGYMIQGFTILIIFGAYFFQVDEKFLIPLISLGLTITGLYGIVYRKKIKNLSSLNVDILFFLSGLILVIPIILYLLGHFDK